MLDVVEDMGHQVNPFVAVLGRFGLLKAYQTECITRKQKTTLSEEWGELGNGYLKEGSMAFIMLKASYPTS